MTEHSIKAGDTTLAVVDHGGDGTPIVLLHGGGRTAADWLPMVPHLAGAGHILAVDFRGHGQSSAAPAFSYEDGVIDVGAVVDGLGLERPVVVGHSLGGMIASIYTARSGAPGALVNVDGHGAGHPSQFDGIPPDEVEAALDKFATMSVEGFNAVVDRGDEAWRDAEIDGFKKAITGSPYTWDQAEPVISRAFRSLGGDQWESSPNSAVNSSMYLSLRALDMMPYYRDLACPSVIIYTTADAPEDDAEIERLLAAHRIGLRRQLNEVAAANANIELTPFPTGHMVMWDQPKELADLIATVVERVAS